MAVREIRTAAQLIGRRNALRYLAIGVGASLVAACSGKGKEAPVAGSASTGASSAPGSSAPPAPAPAAPAPASSGPVARAFDAFIGGTWKLESTTPGDKTVHGTATVTAPPGGNGGFTIVWDADGEPVTWTGSWLLRGGHLRTEVFGGGKELTRLSGSEALTVPATVADAVSLTLPWKPPGAKDAGDGQQLKVSYKNDVLRIVHAERGGSESVHVCTRTT